MTPTPTAPRTRLRIGAGAALVLALAGVAVAVLITATTPHGSSIVIAPSATPSSSAGQMDVGAASVIYIHILGQVQHPGLYALHDGDRAVDIVAAAGGFTPDADPGAVNLARFLSDGEQIVVPAVGEAVGAGGGGGSGAANGKVNLNTADATALEALPRIGPAMAQRILDWREQNGRFSAVEDLLDVAGIGDATFAGLKDLVTV